MTTDFVDTARALALAITQDGKPYLWARKGPDAFDCSGLVSWSIHAAGGPDLRWYYNAQRLWDELEPTRPQPRVICLALYGYAVNGGEHVDHVMWCTGDGRVFGACGGGRHTTSLEIASKEGAKVRFRPRPDYRSVSPLLGYRALQWRPGFPKEQFHA